MHAAVFAEFKFWLLVLFSIVVPTSMYGALLIKRVISPKTVLVWGLLLIVVAGIDIFLLQSLSAKVKLTPSLADDAFFASEVTLALYLLPALFAGIGINVVSHVLVTHLAQAERRFRDEHRKG